MNGWELNIWTVIVALIVNLGIGMLWYSPLLFTRLWRRETGLSDEDLAKGSMPVAFGAWGAGSLVAALALSYLAQRVGAATVTDGIGLGVLVGVALVAASAAGKYAFGQQSLLLFLINEGNTALGIVVMSVIVTVWR